MDTTCWLMNATVGGANLHPGVNLHREQICTRVQIVHINTVKNGNTVRFTVTEIKHKKNLIEMSLGNVYNNV